MKRRWWKKKRGLCVFNFSVVFCLKFYGNNFGSVQRKIKSKAMDVQMKKMKQERNERMKLLDFLKLEFWTLDLNSNGLKGEIEIEHEDDDELFFW